MQLNFLSNIVIAYFLFIPTASSAEKHLAEFSFSVMSYNVENLFDTKNNPLKNDETFLPLSKKSSPEHRRKCAQIRNKSWRKQCLYWDWSEEVLDIKMSRLANAIFSYDPKGPDIILLQEVENKSVLERFRNEYLAKANYQKSIILQGQDARGINVAILTRFPIKGTPRLHRIPFSAPFFSRLSETREILEATLSLPNGDKAGVFVVHFPSPFHPRGMRKQAMKFLNELAAKAKSTHQVVIAGGDFNVTANEDSRVYRRIAAPKWYVSHHVGCENCIGTAYYQREDSWSFLDALMILRQNQRTGYRYYIKPGSIDVANLHPLQTTSDGKPNRFDFHSGQPVGVSDHWPVVLKVAATKIK